MQSRLFILSFFLYTINETKWQCNLNVKTSQLEIVCGRSFTPKAKAL